MQDLKRLGLQQLSFRAVDSLGVAKPDMAMLSTFDARAHDGGMSMTAQGVVMLPGWIPVEK